MSINKESSNHLHKNNKKYNKIKPWKISDNIIEKHKYI